jgi:GH35 family endo-1,4-beta-xylanase
MTSITKAKKRLISLFTATTMAILIFQFAIPVLAAETPIHDTFEVNFDGWINDFETYSQLTAHEGEGVNGSRALKLSERQNTSEAVYSQKGLYLWGGDRYTYSVYVRHEEQGAEEFALTLSWLYSDEAHREETQVIATKTVQPGTWTQIKTSFATPKNTSDLLFSLSTNSTADFYFDEFTATQRKLESPFTVSANVPANPGLKDVYANHFYVGNILNGTTANNTPIRNLILREYNSITAENEHKPDATMTRTGSTNTNIRAQINTGAANIMNFCAQNGIPMRGHVLAWHGQTPDWFFVQDINDTRATNQNAANSWRNSPVSSVPWATTTVMNQRLESYIENLFNIYRTQYPNLVFYAYDVVNEAAGGDGGLRARGFDHQGAGGQQDSVAGASPWQGVYGATSTAWIRNAFIYARRHAPAHTKLFYNDYNEWHEPRRDWIINTLLRPYFQEGILDGMGMQGHVSADTGQWAWSRWARQREAMDRYAAIGAGFEVQITELDVVTNNGEFLSIQPERYRQIFQHAIDINARGAGQFTAICMWGPNDANSWITRRAGRENEAPLLHDTSNQPKPAYTATFNVVPQSQWGNGSNPEFRYNSVLGGNQAPLQPNEFGWWFHDTFEGTSDPARLFEWTPRGGATTIASTTTTPLLGARSLSVRERGASWHGAQKRLNPLAFVAGTAYSFSVCAVYTSSSGATTETFALTLEYTDTAGETRWANIATAATNRNRWVQLSNRNFTIPAGATNLTLIVETRNDSTVAFYMDEAIGAVAGTVINAPAGANPPLEDTTPDTPEALFATITPTESHKTALNNNPLMTQRFTADPGSMVYNGRVYVYTTNDVIERDGQGNIIENTYMRVNTINVKSSADLVNWTDHGAIPAAGTGGAATFASQSWAPAAAWKTINGVDRFFLYFCNNASGVVVLTSNSPIGPWTSPRSNMLINNNTPGVNRDEIPWLFDPAVFVDDDGQGYLYFGGGIPGGSSPTPAQYANPRSARVIRLSDDMTSTVGSAVMIDAPYMFEASEMNKIGDTYYYSYCTNFNTNFSQSGIRGGTIHYMTSNNPMGPFTHRGELLRNPSEFFPNNGGNNHHSFVELNGQHYMFYHTRQLQNAMGITGNYRSTHIDRLNVNSNGTLQPVQATMTGVPQIGTLNPYETQRASTIARQAGINVRGVGNTIVTDISRGDWVSVKGASFSRGSNSVTVRVASQNGGVIKVATGSPTGTAIGFIEVPATGSGFTNITAPVSSLTGNQDVYFIFSAPMEFESWSFASNHGISLNPTGTIVFPEAVVGYAQQTARTITVSNTGTQATGALTVALSGTNASSFTLSTASLTSIAAGTATRTFTVRPNNGLTAGTYTATVTVSGGNGISSSFNVSFTVTPATTRSIALSPAGSLTFSPANVGYAQQTARTITVSNTGTQATGALTVALSGTNASSFTLSATSLLSISAGITTRNFTIRPNNGLSAGTYTATVTVSNGSDISESFNVSFTVTPATGYLFHDTFEPGESGIENWSGRGDATVAISGRVPFRGSEALLVRDRTASWQGTARNLNSSAFIAGNSYSFSVWVTYLEGGNETEEFALTLIFTDEAGDTRFARIAAATVQRGRYAQLANTNYTIPAGASNLMLMVESTSGSFNFYIDEAIGAVAGTVITHLATLYISEVNDDSSNENSWIELTNPTEGAVSTKGLYLSNREGVEEDGAPLWQMPSFIIPAGGTLRIAASGNAQYSQFLKRARANFNLSSSVRLVDVNGNVLSFYEIVT